MLRILYKTLLISVLSCSLMMMDFNSKGLSFLSAQAETVSTDKITDNDMMATLTMVAVGALASRLFTYKPTTDIMLAAAGGAAFLAGEILAFVKLKAAMKGMEMEITRDSKGNINAEQVKALERLKKSYEEAKKTAGIKKMLQMAAAAAFAGAAATAFMSASKDVAASVACNTGVTAAMAAIPPEITKCAALGLGAPACVTAVTACGTSLGAFRAGLIKYEFTRQAIGPSAIGLAATLSEGGALSGLLGTTAGACTVAPAAAAAISGPCAPMVPAHIIDASGGPVITMMAENSPIIKRMLLEKNLDAKNIASLMAEDKAETSNYFNKFLNLVFPTANAGIFSMMGVVSSAAVAFLLITSKTLGVTIDSFLLIPQKRAIIWGVIGALTVASIMATGNVVKKLDANIKKIDDILKGLNTFAPGTGTTQITPTIAAKGGTSSTLPKTPNLNLDGTTYEAIDLKKDGGESLPCFTGNAENGNCKSFEQVTKDLPSYAGLNPESQKQIDGLMKVGDGFNGKSNITAGALSSAASLANSANALNSNADAAKKKLIAALKASGSKINPDAMSKSFADDMEKSVRAALVKSGSTPSGMMASIYGGSSKSGSSEDAAKLAAEKAAADADAKKTATAGGNVYDMQAGAIGTGSSGLTGLNSGKTPSDSAAQGIGLLSSAEALNGLELDHNDISTDAKANLFELISNRYQQSGYRRLFKLKESSEAVPVKK